MLSYLPRAIALFALASSVAASAARADDYPFRPVKLIAPFGAGGATDVFTRDIAEELRNALHQTFYIENRPGAGPSTPVWPGDWSRQVQRLCCARSRTD